MRELVSFTESASLRTTVRWWMMLSCVLVLTGACSDGAAPTDVGRAPRPAARSAVAAPAAARARAALADAVGDAIDRVLPSLDAGGAVSDGDRQALAAALRGLAAALDRTDAPLGAVAAQLDRALAPLEDAARSPSDAADLAALRLLADRALRFAP